MSANDKEELSAAAIAAITEYRAALQHLGAARARDVEMAHRHEDESDANDRALRAADERLRAARKAMHDALGVKP